MHVVGPEVQQKNCNRALRTSWVLPLGAPCREVEKAEGQCKSWKEPKQARVKGSDGKVESVG